MKLQISCEKFDLGLLFFQKSKNVFVLFPIINLFFLLSFNLYKGGHIISLFG
jgi:hypothetical protein